MAAGLSQFCDRFGLQASRDRATYKPTVSGRAVRLDHPMGRHASSDILRQWAAARNAGAKRCELDAAVGFAPFPVSFERAPPE
jgi:hypothetical protein